MDQIDKTRPIAPVLPAAKDPFPKQGEVKRKPGEDERKHRERDADDGHHELQPAVQKVLPGDRDHILIPGPYPWIRLARPASGRSLRHRCPPARSSDSRSRPVSSDSPMANISRPARARSAMANGRTGNGGHDLCGPGIQARADGSATPEEEPLSSLE